MYENDMKSTAEHTGRAPGKGEAATGRSDAATRGSDAATRRSEPATRRRDPATPRTDPKFARESFTLRRMQTWQIAALAIAAALVVALVLFYT